jgi:hypothetical protein
MMVNLTQHTYSCVRLRMRNSTAFPETQGGLDGIKWRYDAHASEPFCVNNASEDCGTYGPHSIVLTIHYHYAIPDLP